MSDAESHDPALQTIPEHRVLHPHEELLIGMLELAREHTEDRRTDDGQVARRLFVSGVRQVPCESGPQRREDMTQRCREVDATRRGWSPVCVGTKDPSRCWGSMRG